MARLRNEAEQHKRPADSQTPKLGKLGLLLAVVPLVVAAAEKLTNTLRLPAVLMAILVVIGALGSVGSLVLDRSLQRRAEQRAAETAATRQEEGSKRLREERQRTVNGLLAIPISETGALPRASEVDPFGPVGVSSSKYVVRGGSPPPYAPRHADRQLDDALGRSSFVLLVGNSKAGKSRTAFEAVRRQFPSAPLIVPRGDTGVLGQLLAIDPPVQAGIGLAVLWLDDLERYLGPGGLDLSLIERITHHQDRVVMVATMTSLRRDAVLGTHGEIGRTARLVIDQAVTISLATALSDEERTAAEQLYPHEDFTRGIGEQLVAAASLEQRYEDGREASPTGWALVQAAVDWRRAGISRPIREVELRDLYPLYLSELRVDLEPDERLFEQGLTWARRPVASHIALLEVVDGPPERSFQVFDYIVAYADGQGGNARREVAEGVWNRVIASIAQSAPDDLLSVGTAAYVSGAKAIARRAWSRAVDTGHPDAAPRAAVSLGRLSHEQGDPDAAVVLFERAINSGHPDAAPEAAVSLGGLLQERGDPDGARRLFQQAVDSGHPDAAPRAAGAAALLLAAGGDLEGARSLFQQAVDSGHPDAAPRAAVALGILLAAQNETQGAMAALEQAVKSGNTIAAPWAAIALGHLLDKQDDFSGARAAYQQAVDSGDPDAACQAAVALGWLLARQGDYPSAERAYETALTGAHRDISAWATGALGTLREVQGCLHEARGCYQQAVDSGHPGAAPWAMDALGEHLLALQSDFDEARDHFQQAIDSGHPSAAPWAAAHLGLLLAVRGDVAAARRLYEEVIDTYFPPGTVVGPLEILLAEAEQQRFLGFEHRRVLDEYRRVIDSRDPQTAPWAAAAMGIMMAAGGDLEGGRRLFQQAVDSGHPDAAPRAAGAAALLLAAGGDLEEARGLLEQAISSGHPDAAPRAAAVLGVLLTAQGDVEGASAVFEQAIESGHTEAAPWAREALDRLLGYGRPDSFLDAYQRAVGTGDHFRAGRLAVALGRLHQAHGSVVNAQAAYQRAIDAGDPAVAGQAALALGRLHEDRGQGVKARVAYQRAIDAGDPAVAGQAALALGRLHERQLADAREPANILSRMRRRARRHDLGSRAAMGPEDLLQQEADWLEVERLYRRATESGDPGIAGQAALSLGRLLEIRDDPVGAQAAYRLAADLRKDEGDVSLALQRLSFTVDYQEALKDGRLDAAVQVAVTQAVFLAAREDWSGANRALHVAAEKCGHPHAKAQVVLALGLLLEGRGTWPRAQEASRAMADASHPDLAVDFAAGVARFMVGDDWANAWQTHRQEVDAAGSSVSGWMAVAPGRLAESLGDLATAKKAYQHTIDGGDPDARSQAGFALGRLLEEQDDLAGAQHAWEQATAITGPSAHRDDWAEVSRGRLAETQGDFPAAREAYQRAIDGGDPDARSQAGFALGRLLEEQDDLAGAHEAFYEAIRAGDPDAAGQAIAALERCAKQGHLTGGLRLAIENLSSLRDNEINDPMWVYLAPIDAGILSYGELGGGSQPQDALMVLDLLAAYTHAQAAGDAAAAGGLALALRLYLVRRIQWRRLVRLKAELSGAYWAAANWKYWDAVRAYGWIASAEDRATAAEAEIILGHLVRWGGELHRASRCYRHVIRTGEREQAGRAAVSLGALLRERNRYRKAQRAYELAIRIADNPDVVTSATLGLASVHEDMRRRSVWRRPRLWKDALNDFLSSR